MTTVGTVPSTAANPEDIEVILSSSSLSEKEQESSSSSSSPFIMIDHHNPSPAWILPSPSASKQRRGRNCFGFCCPTNAPLSETEIQEDDKHDDKEIAIWIQQQTDQPESHPQPMMDEPSSSNKAQPQKQNEEAKKTIHHDIIDIIEDIPDLQISISGADDDVSSTFTSPMTPTPNSTTPSSSNSSTTASQQTRTVLQVPAVPFFQNTTILREKASDLFLKLCQLLFAMMVLESSSTHKKTTHKKTKGDKCSEEGNGTKEIEEPQQDPTENHTLVSLTPPIQNQS